jgi:succinoglycan biosynthesis transport protein ExoP
MATKKQIPRFRQGDAGDAKLILPRRSFVEHESGMRSSPDEPTIVEYWRVLVRRRKTVFVFTAALLLLATAASFLMEPRYSAESRISVERENPDMLQLKNSGYPSLDVSEYNMELDAQVQILSSDTLILENLRQLRNKTSAPGSQPNMDLTVAQAVPVSIEEQKLVIQYGDHLVVSRIPHTPLISIKFSDQDPQFAEEFVNGLVRVYIEQNFKTKYESARQVSGWLSSQLEELRAKTEVSQSRLAAFQKKTGILGTDDKQNIITQKLDDINRELTIAQSDRIQKQALYQATLSGNLESLPGIAENPIIKQLKEEQAVVSNNYARATTEMGPAHPTVLGLKSQLEQIDGMLQSEFTRIEERNHNAYIVAARREAMLGAALDSQKEAANKLNEKAVEYERLKHEVQSDQQLYDSLSERLKESGVSAGLRSGNVRVVDYAQRPYAPSVPNIPLNLAAGLFLGCIGGATLAFIWERLDNRMHTALQIEDVSALPLIGVVPRIPGGAKGILTAGATSGAEAMTTEITILTVENYRALCISMMQMSQRSPQVILITSAVPSEGKTTTCLNCAKVLAQQGNSVLLVDADLRASRTRPNLDSHTSSHLATILEERPNFSDGQTIVQHACVPNLSILHAGPAMEDSYGLLDAVIMKQKISEWRNSYSHIIIDTPPVLAYSDAIALAPFADSVVLVVFAGKTPRPAFLRARNLLMGVNAAVSGVVVNGLDFGSTEYGAYGYGYNGYKKRWGN